MREYLTAGATALLLVLAGCGGGAGNGTAGGNAAPAAPTAQLKQIPAPNGGDWTQIVSETERGFRMGNPDAPVKLVEFASITCSHCAEFAEGGTAPLRDRYVRSGQVSWEYRPYMIFPTDPGLFALLRCRGPEPFFQLVEQLYTDQRTWGMRAQEIIRQQEASLSAMSPNDRAVALIRGAQLDQFFRQRGMPQSQIDSCLANPENLRRVADLTARTDAEERIRGTPAFYINGNAADAGSWAQLEPLLRQAIGG